MSADEPFEIKQTNGKLQAILAAADKFTILMGIE